jgi:hypothetical protein
LVEVAANLVGPGMISYEKNDIDNEDSSEEIALMLMESKLDLVSDHVLLGSNKSRLFCTGFVVSLIP